MDYPPDIDIITARAETINGILIRESHPNNVRYAVLRRDMLICAITPEKSTRPDCVNIQLPWIGTPNELINTVCYENENRILS